MRQVFEDQDAAREVGRRAFEDLRSTNSPEVASAAIERKYRAQHAEALAGFRRTRAELKDLRRQLATVERHVEPKSPIETSE